MEDNDLNFLFQHSHSNKSLEIKSGMGTLETIGDPYHDKLEEVDEEESFQVPELDSPRLFHIKLIECNIDLADNQQYLTEGKELSFEKVRCSTIMEGQINETTNSGD